MDKIVAGLITGIVGILLIGLVALLGGTLVWWFWPHFISDILPGAVASGALPETLPWWPTILFTWACGILFKGAGSNSVSD
jgi:hypothetical protein